MGLEDGAVLAFPGVGKGGDDVTGGSVAGPETGGSDPVGPAVPVPVDGWVAPVDGVAPGDNGGGVPEGVTVGVWVGAGDDGGWTLCVDGGVAVGDGTRG